MIVDMVHDRVSTEAARVGAAARLARLARAARSDEDAVEAVQKALEELLS
jgi:histone H3/H4